MFNVNGVLKQLYIQIYYFSDAVPIRDMLDSLT